jgi:hypothetical protein
VTPDPAEAARLALYCYSAEHIGPVEMPPATQEAQGAIISGGPPLPPWIAATHSLVGWLSGQDAFFEDWLNLGAKRVFYGFVTESEAGQHVIIRGTESMAEWAIDGTFLPKVAHPGDGCVETGFWDLFKSLQFRDLKGTDGPPLEAFSDKRPIAFTGHSLGAPLAEYLALAAAEAFGSAAVRGRFFASPHPGDGAFADYFASRVTDYVCYAYERDLVPRVPGGMGYSPLHNLTMLPANARVSDNPVAAHHAGNYAFELDPSSIALLPEAERIFPT